jgi:ribosome maturation protein Sdo1
VVSLDDAVIAKLKKGEEHFEILVDPDAAADVIDGKGHKHCSESCHRCNF